MKIPLKIILIILAIFLALAALIGAFTFLRPQVTEYNESNDVVTLNKSTQEALGMTNVESFSDPKKNITSTTGSNKTGTTRPTITPKPLPYPRILINYSMQRTSTIGSNIAGENTTFVHVLLDIRNFGYRYFDAFPNNFRGILSGNEGDETIPLVNISTGNTIDAVIPNNSRAKGDLQFLIDNKKLLTKIIYSPVNKSEKYYITYKILSASEMGDNNGGITNDEEN